MRNLFLAAAAVAVSLLPIAAAAQEKTPANAFAFIRTNLTDGSWSARYEFCYRGGACEDREGTVTSVTFLDPAYCHLSFRIQGDAGPVTMSVDLRQSITVRQSQQTIFFAGPIKRSNGPVIPNWLIMAGSIDIAYRVGMAFDFLAERCRANTGPW